MNIKKEIYDKVQKQNEENMLLQQKIQAEKEFNRRMDRGVDRETNMFQQEDHAVLNKVWPAVDYGVAIDKEEVKNDINMVIIGHVDAGKSTLMGHLLT